MAIQDHLIVVHVPTESSLAHQAQQIVQIVLPESMHMALVHPHVHSVLLGKSLPQLVSETAMIARLAKSLPLLG